MAKAWIENSMIRDVCPVGLNPLFLYGQDIGANYSTDVPDDAQNGWVEIEGQWQAPPPPPPPPPAPPVIPQSITRAQGIAALILDGKDDLVQPAIDGIVDPVERKLAQNDWDNRLTFQRNNATLIALATAIGMTEEQLDQMFILGATL